jgi:hypothetical protein
LGGGVKNRRRRLVVHQNPAHPEPFKVVGKTIGGAGRRHRRYGGRRHAAEQTDRHGRSRRHDQPQPVIAVDAFGEEMTSYALNKYCELAA